MHRTEINATTGAMATIALAAYADAGNNVLLLDDGDPAPEGYSAISDAEYAALLAPTTEQLAAIAAAHAKAVKDAADAQEAREDAQLAAIAALTPAQAAQWIEDNVTNLAEAKSALKIMAKALCILARRI